MVHFAGVEVRGQVAVGIFHTVQIPAPCLLTHGEVVATGIGASNNGATVAITTAVAFGNSANSISIEADAFKNLVLSSSSPLNVTPTDQFGFWLRGLDNTVPSIRVSIVDGAGSNERVEIDTTDEWVYHTFTFSQFNITQPTDISTIYLKLSSPSAGEAAPATFYVDQALLHWK